jgi:hypothetical protein
MSDARDGFSPAMPVARDSNLVDGYDETKVGSTQTVRNRHEQPPISDEYDDPGLSDSSEIPDFQAELTLPQSIVSAIEESKTLIVPGYVAQKWDHREFVVDYMLQLGILFGQPRLVVYHAVSLMDRFIEKSGIPTTDEEAELLGACCMFMAIKFEHSTCDRVERFVKLCQDKFSASDFGEKEVEICTLLEYRLAVPTAELFVEPLLMAIERLDVIKTVNYYLDILLMHDPYFDVSCALLAVVAICGALGEFCPCAKLFKLTNFSIHISILGEKLIELSEHEQTLTMKGLAGPGRWISDIELIEMRSRLEASGRFFLSKL